MHDEIKEDSRRIMDDYVTLRLLILLSGAALATFGGVVGFLWGEISTNRNIIETFPTVIAEKVEMNSQFQIEQRIRVWDELSRTQADIIEIDRNQARLEGRLEIIIGNLDRVIDRLDSNAKNQ
jgi:hypothetical protein